MMNSNPSKSSKIKELKTLKGIWAKKGFEKIEDINVEILNVRNELAAQILKKKF